MTNTKSRKESKSRRIPDALWRWMRPLNLRIARNYHGHFPARRLVLLLTSKGRVSGLDRVTPLQYEEVDGVYYVASARGKDADWFQNILVNPKVKVHLREQLFQALAEPVTDPVRIADFLELRLERHPKMLSLMLRLEGLPAGFDRHELEQFAAEKAMVAIHPLTSEEE